MSKKVKP